MKNNKPSAIVFWASVVCLLLAFANHSTAQTTEYKKDKGKEPFLQVRFQLGVNALVPTLTTKEGFQLNTYPIRSLLYSIGPEGHYYSDSDCFKITEVKPNITSGFAIGLVLEKKIGKKLDFQVDPTLVLGTQCVIYDVDIVSQTGESVSRIKVVSNNKLSTSFEFPLLLKYRVLNNYFYLIGGVNPKFHIQSLKKGFNSSGLPSFLETDRFDLSAEVGLGSLFYKNLGLQVKFSLGLLDVIKGQKYKDSFFYLPIESVHHNQLQITVLF